jgi:hypothetical protein
MTNREFYRQVTMLPYGKCGLKEYYQALYDLIEIYKFKNLSWELLVELLTRAGQVAEGEPLEEGNPLDHNGVISLEDLEEIDRLLKYLKAQIRNIEEYGIPQSSETGMSYDDSVFNWKICIILERGAAYLMNDEAEYTLEKPPRWETLLALIEIGREYE